MAVRFDGRTSLLPTELPGYFGSNVRYPCGVAGYWFQATDLLDASILQSFNWFPNGGVVSGVSNIRIEHLVGTAPLGYGLTVFLQNEYEVGAGNPAAFGMNTWIPATNFRPYYDGNWHHVLIAWNIGVNPPVCQIILDGYPQLTFRDRYMTGVNPATTGALEFAGPNHYANGPVKWSVGDTQFQDNPGQGPFKGNLERLFFYASQEDYTDTQQQTHCDAILINKKHGGTDAGHEPVAVPMIPDGYYVFCRTTPNTLNASLTDPEHAQIALSGTAATFPKNYGGKLPDPFGLSTIFPVTGALTDAPTDP